MPEALARSAPRRRAEHRTNSAGLTLVHQQGEPVAGKQLTTQNALITTASVEVKTLTISAKQVTLAVG